MAQTSFGLAAFWRSSRRFACTRRFGRLLRNQRLNAL